MTCSYVARCLVATSIFFSLSAPSRSSELFPGPVHDPAGLQFFQRIVYNPTLDDYLVLYEDGRALVGHLSPAGVFSGQTVISGNLGITHVNAAFNPDDETFLLVYRLGAAATFYGRYLDSDGMPIGTAFLIGPGGGGFGPSVAYTPSNGGRYLVTWEHLAVGLIKYRVIDGDATSAVPLITGPAAVSNGLSEASAYGSVAQKFLVVYVREVPGSKASVFGRFISGNGLTVGPEFPVSHANESQGVPRIAYAPSTNRWMVMYENWNSCGGGCPHIRGAIVSETGAIVSNVTIASTAGWDQPGFITYNPVTDTFIAGWRSAISDTNVQARAGEFSPVNGALVRPTVLLSDLDMGVEGAAARPDAVEPQAVFVTREGFGGNGIHAHIMNLPAPVPDTFSPENVMDLSAAPEPGGNPVPATAISSTSAFPSPTDMRKTTDGSVATYWQTPARASIKPEFITWDLGVPTDVSNVSLRARSAGNLFPVDYEIQVSTDNLNFTSVFSVVGAAPAPGTWVDHLLPDPNARYVRLRITKTKKSGSGKFMAQVAEVEILEATAGETLAIHWTAPGDDDAVGTAADYDLRWSLNPITAGNFNAATVIPTPNPHPAGAAESVMVQGFPSEDIVYFALKTSDEIPNTSGLSNVLQFTTPGVPPAPVIGLAASDPTGDEVDLVWQPSGDNGNNGNATTYDIRYSPSPITEGNFAAAPSVLRPATNPKPALESFTLPGLSNQTTYFIAIKALDDVGLASGLNAGPPVITTTLDVVAPAVVNDLTAAIGGGTPVFLTAPAIASSGDSSSTTGRTKATDRVLTSYWQSLSRNVMLPEFITLDTGAVRNLGRVRLHSRPAGALFPQDLQIQVSNNNVSFSTVDTAVGLPATPGIWHTFDFGPATGRYVRVLITRTRLSAGGQFIAQIAEIEAYEVAGSNEMTLDWTAPGDDAGAGTAALFDVRYSTSSIDTVGEFNSATPIDGEPTPGPAGSAASVTFEAPEEGVNLFFVMRTHDEAGNQSALSNQVSETSNVVPPAAVSDLLAFNATSTSIELSWTSTGDDGVVGTATSFEVRRSESPITSGNFNAATPVSGEPVPAVAGTLQGVTVDGLDPSTTYHFAMRVHDETSTPSPISNVVSAATDAPDTTAPSEVTDLAGSAPFTVDLLPAPAIQASSVESATAGFMKATDGINTSYWGTLLRAAPTVEFITVDTGSLHDIGEVRLLSRPAGALFPLDLEIQVSSNNTIFTTVETATGLPATQGLLHTFNFPAVSARYVRIRITRTRVTGAGLYAAQIAEIQVFEASFLGGPVTLEWTAPGDDGPNGTAALYDVRYSTTAIVTLADFNAATPVVGEPLPQAAGSHETLEVSLSTGVYHFAMRTRDEVPNQSGLSNVAIVVVP